MRVPLQVLDTFHGKRGERNWNLKGNNKIKIAKFARFAVCNYLATSHTSFLDFPQIYDCEYESIADEFVQGCQQTPPSTPPEGHALNFKG